MPLTVLKCSLGNFPQKATFKKGYKVLFQLVIFFLGLDADPVEMKDGKEIRYSWPVFILYSLSIYVYLYTDEPM